MGAAIEDFIALQVAAESSVDERHHRRTVQQRGHFTLCGFRGTHVLRHFGHRRVFGIWTLVVLATFFMAAWCHHHHQYVKRIQAARAHRVKIHRAHPRPLPPDVRGSRVRRIGQASGLDQGRARSREPARIASTPPHSPIGLFEALDTVGSRH